MSAIKITGIVYAGVIQIKIRLVANDPIFEYRLSKFYKYAFDWN